MVWVAPASRAMWSLASSTSIAMVCALRKADAAMAPSPTAPAPENRYRILFRDTAPGNRVKADRQRLDDAQLFERESFSDENFGSGDGDQIGQSAIALDTQGLVGFAGVDAAAQTGSALAATGVWRECDVHARPSARCANPTSSTVAAISWPGMRGNDTIGFLPRKVLRSEPQKPIMRTRSRTSPDLGAGSAVVADSDFPGFLDDESFHGSFPTLSDAATGLCPLRDLTG